MLKGVRICVEVFFFCSIIRLRLFFLDCVGQLLLHHEAHVPTTHTVLLHQRSAPMASVPTGGQTPLLPPLGRAQLQQQKQHLLLQHLPAAAAVPTAATKAAAIPAAVTTRAIDLPSEECKDNASDLLAGASDATAAVLIPGSTTTHTKVNVAAIFGQKMSPV